MGHYSSYAPACCGPLHGCSIGAEEAEQLRVADAIMEDVALLHRATTDPTSQEAIVSRLQQNCDRLRNMTSALLTPLDVGERTLRAYCQLSTD
jgi:hypothetical protein